MAPAARLALAVALTVAALVLTVQASDPELTSDFYVPHGTNRSSMNITGDYFTSMLFRNASQFGMTVAPPAKTAILRLTSENTPVLAGLGVSSALIKYLPGGINPPHTHPRGTELLIVVDGTLTVGLVDTANKFYTKVLEVGDVFVFPKGLVHYQINNGKEDVVAYLSFSSSNPGTVSLPATLFGSGIPDNVHETAFRVDRSVVDQLQKAFYM